MTDVRVKITQLEEEIRAENEELWVDFDSGSSVFPSTDSGWSSSESSLEAPAKVAAPSCKGKSKPSRTVAAAEGESKKVRPRKRRPCPGAPAPDHRGWPNSEAVKLPGFRRRRLAVLCCLRAVATWFPQCNKGTPSQGHAVWAPLAKGS